ncbi:L-lysine 6-monooxygenase (NADPH-requiring)-domain-containing protein [Dactylonectria macrodidyma]|uniref:L-ornithine N(5)-monooxygenase [NAD(P)H] n=1 Tax=Dactylonectria macrodidyma TaxID=307937 RepID=A0A9P9JDM3_9HYPO|nr:L-lysine 6-monooxygenase (NADPH-requiring)-domain-containing protein [Dactylonectria macrodidyma]
MTPHSDVSEDAGIPVHTNGASNGTNGINGAAPALAKSTTNGISNGTTTFNGNTTPSSPGPKVHKERSKYLESSPLDSEFDLICAGFGPASLAVAIAMNDAIANGQKLRADGAPPKVLFLEKQAAFAWHAGMLLEGAKMQISFIKDLATLRDPRSEFTFLNYVHRNDRLIDFTNLDTFLPARAEFEDYLRWCSSFFDHVVQYNNEVVAVTPVDKQAGAVKTFTVQARNGKTGQLQSFRTKQVLIAAGGQASLPKSLPSKNPRVLHSSQFATYSRQILTNKDAPYRVAVLGAGQSAAEIFNNVQQLYPNSKTSLLMRQEFLRPSDDSPFVNTIFNPEYVDNIYPRSASSRQSFLDEVRATNYGVVRLNLIEHLYEKMYEQKRLIGADETQWPHRILSGREITSVEDKGDKIEIRLQKIHDIPLDGFVDASDEEVLEVDLIVAATGYKRDAHVNILKDAWTMLPKTITQRNATQFSKPVTGWNVDTDQGERKLAVGRDYKVKFQPGSVAEGSGVWLQGCCEGTHGLSDTLLSVLATRSGEMVNNIFQQ